jgi:hypothetical protein
MRLIGYTGDYVNDSEIAWRQHGLLTKKVHQALADEYIRIIRDVRHIEQQQIKHKQPDFPTYGHQVKDIIQDVLETLPSDVVRDVYNLPTFISDYVVSGITQGSLINLHTYAANPDFQHTVNRCAQEYMETNIFNPFKEHMLRHFGCTIPLRSDLMMITLPNIPNHHAFIAHMTNFAQR